MRRQEQQDTAARPARTAPAVARPTGTAGPAGSGGPAAATGLPALQRAAGNAAVVRALERQRAAGPHPHRPSGGHGDQASVQRHAHGPSCGHDEAAPVQRSSVPDVLGTAGQPLDGAVRAEMEARLGADFSDVRLHTGPAAQRSAAEIGARAYTSGNHVVIGAGGADRHTLAHELTHVVQQRQGPVEGTDNGAGLSVSDPPTASNARRRRTPAAPWPGPCPPGPRPCSGRPPLPPAAAGIAVQRLGGGEAPFDHAQYYARTGWQQAAEEFEKRLGAYCFGHPKALAAARAAVNRLKQLLIAYARTEHKDPALANKAFFKNDRTSAYQVGEGMATEQIKEFFSRDGNVRELVTALYNAAYYNKGTELSLKRVLEGVLGPKPQLASTLGMNEEELKKHSAFLNSWSRLPMWAAANLVGKGYNYEKDPYALGNLLWQSNPESFAGDTREMINSQGPRTPRSEADKEAHRKTPATTRTAAPAQRARTGLRRQARP
ncbi:DUF4157 domain-containing protein [Streptomyces thermocarboxydus]